MQDSSKAILGLFALVVVIGGSFLGFRWWQAAQDEGSLPPSQQPVMYDPRPVSFSLTDSSGETFTSDQLRGRTWLAIFFFTRCPVACLKMNEEFARLAEEFPADEVGFLSISCDPSTDTPAELRDYAKNRGFDKEPERWRFLTGDLEDIKRIGRDSFNLTVVEKDHSFRTVVIDRSGKSVAAFMLTDPHEARELRKYLKQKLSEPSPDDAAPAGYATRPAEPATAAQ